MKKAIIIVSFGCSIKDVRRKYIQTIEDSIKDNFSDVDCFRVFTSEVIRKKIKREENIEIDNMKTCLEKLKKEKYTHIYISSTHIIPGIEYEKILRSIEEYKDDFESINTSRTFLDDKMGISEVDVIKSYVKTDLNDDEAVVLIGHGSRHPSHKYYHEFQKLLKGHLKNMYIANIEGSTFVNDIITSLKEENIKKIYLYPFLIVAGDHAINDIASDDENSIKTTLIHNGFLVDAFITGLGSNEETKKLFVKRLSDIICFN